MLHTTAEAVCHSFPFLGKTQPCLGIVDAGELKQIPKSAKKSSGTRTAETQQSIRLT